MKAIAASVMFLASLPLASHYTNVDKEAACEEKTINDKIESDRILADQKEQQRKDSLAFYIKRSKQLGKNHKIDEAKNQLQFALSFAISQSERAQIEKQKTSIASIKTIDLVKAGRYSVALPEINHLLESDPNNSDLLYNRAICLSNAGKVQEAVSDLKPLISAGNPAAEKLHDKINPIRKRVSYYVTRCCDGTNSSAKGRGACSHHGGVCNWNEPVYEEYRKYE